MSDDLTPEEKVDRMRITVRRTTREGKTNSTWGYGLITPFGQLESYGHATEASATASANHVASLIAAGIR